MCALRSTWAGYGAHGLGMDHMGWVWSTWVGYGAHGLGMEHMGWVWITWAGYGAHGLGMDHMGWVWSTWAGYGAHGLGMEHMGWVWSTWAGYGAHGLGIDHMGAPTYIVSGLTQTSLLDVWGRDDLIVNTVKRSRLNITVLFGNAIISSHNQRQLFLNANNKGLKRV